MSSTVTERCAYVRLRGRVQGVGFRYWTRSQAMQLGIRGWVRNCADESVEAMLCGPEPDLQTMLKRLRRGPVMARVESMEIRWLDTTPENSGFQIIYP